MITYEVSEQEANLIVQALAKLPYEISVQLIEKLIKIGNEQVKKKEEQ